MFILYMVDFFTVYVLAFEIFDGGFDGMPGGTSIKTDFGFSYA